MAAGSAFTPLSTEDAAPGGTDAFAASTLSINRSITMKLRSRSLRVEELESRRLLSLPSAAPPLGPPPAPGPGVVWVHTEPALQRAIRNLHSDETVVIQKGTYRLTHTLGIGLQTAVHNVTIRGETDNFNDVVLLGKGMENSHFGPVPTGISVFNGQDIRIANLSIGEAYFHPIELYANRGAQSIDVYHV